MRVIGSCIAALIVIASFVGFVALHAVKSRVATQTYFTSVLHRGDVYERLYRELLADPEFATEVDEMLGGVDVRRDQLIATFKKLVPPEYLETIATTVIAHLVSHLDCDAHLDLTFDITRIVQGVHGLALEAAAQGLASIPVKQLESYDELVVELDKLVAALRSDGTLPAAIPHAAIPPDQRDAVVARIVEAAGLDPSRPSEAAAIAAIKQAIAADDVAAALRAAASSLLEDLIVRSIEQLTHNPYVTRVNLPDGPHFLFGPGDDVGDHIDRKLAIVRDLDHAAGLGRIVTAALFVISLVVLALLHRRDHHALAWTGATLLVAGAVAFVGWHVVHGLADRSLAAVAASSTLPASFRAILDDIFRIGVADFTLGFWLPAAACAAFGGILVVIAAVRR